MQERLIPVPYSKSSTDQAVSCFSTIKVYFFGFSIFICWKSTVCDMSFFVNLFFLLSFLTQTSVFSFFFLIFFYVILNFLCRHSFMLILLDDMSWPLTSCISGFMFVVSLLPRLDRPSFLNFQNYTFVSFKANRLYNMNGYNHYVILTI